MAAPVPAIPATTHVEAAYTPLAVWDARGRALVLLFIHKTAAKARDWPAARYARLSCSDELNHHAPYSLNFVDSATAPGRIRVGSLL